MARRKFAINYERDYGFVLERHVKKWKERSKAIVGVGGDSQVGGTERGSGIEKHKYRIIYSIHQ